MPNLRKSPLRQRLPFPQECAVCIRLTGSSLTAGTGPFHNHEIQPSANCGGFVPRLSGNSHLCNYVLRASPRVTQLDGNSRFAWEYQASGKRNYSSSSPPDKLPGRPNSMMILNAHGAIFLPSDGPLNRADDTRER